MDIALCAEPDVNPDWWFSDDRYERSAAKSVCAACPRQLSCAELARTADYGIWGGIQTKGPSRERLREERRLDKIERHAAIVRLREEGLSYEAIAERVGFSKSGVIDYLSRHKRTA